MRTILLFTFLFTILLGNAQEVSFIWSDDTLNGEYFEKTAIKIPVQLEGDTNTYYFQFDTGANHSSLYTKGADSTFVNRIAEKEINSSIGTLKLDINSSMSFSTAKGNTIGTIGSDILKDKAIEIDYNNQKIKFLSQYNENKYQLSDISKSFGRPVINIEVKGKPYPYLFDTGASLFDLWTTKKYWNKWKDKEASISEFPIYSWGKTNTAYRTQLKAPTNINGWPTTSVKQVWYNSNKNFNKLFKEADVDGIIGNVPFLNEVILIDMKNLKMGVKKI